MLKSLYRWIISGSLIWQIDCPPPFEKDTLHVDIGCGSNPRNPFSAQKVLGLEIEFVDIDLDTVWDPRMRASSFEFREFDITEKLPLDDNQANSISAFDVIEHVPRWERRNEKVRFPFVDLMSEIFRVLKPGGIFLAVTPAFPSENAFMDPTHVNIISIHTADVFGVKDVCQEFKAMYGFQGKFEILHNNWLKGGGPSLVHNLSRNLFLQDSNLLKKIEVLLKYFVRILRMVISRKKPSHILWVLRKPVPDSSATEIWSRL